MGGFNGRTEQKRNIFDSNVVRFYELG